MRRILAMLALLVSLGAAAQLPSTLGLSAPAQVTLGQAIQLRATVYTSVPAVSGDVTFYSDGAWIAVAAVAITNSATVTVTLPRGTHVVTARYSGSIDGRVAPSTASPVTVVVLGQPTTTWLQFSAAVISAGQPLRIHSFVYTTDGGQATGKIFFYADGIEMGYAYITAAGGADFWVSTLLPGTHSLTTAYAGDTRYEPSASSNALNVTVMPHGHLTGISTRAQVMDGDEVLIGGFIISGTEAKKVVINARGPSLAAQGVAGAMSNPTLQLIKPDGSTVVNDDWSTASYADELWSLGASPPDPLDSSILATLEPGLYTAIVSGPPGIASVEAYEIDHAGSPFTAISTRGLVQSGDGVMIAGFIITGDSPQSVLVRARGPSLGRQGVPGALANPMLLLVAKNGIVAANDDWSTAPNAAQIVASGMAPGDPRESAILLTLEPGQYTAVMQGVAGATGIGIIEVYAQ